MWKYFPKLKPTYICISVTDVHLDTVAKHRHRESVIPFQSQCLQKKDKTPPTNYFNPFLNDKNRLFWLCFMC